MSTHDDIRGTHTPPTMSPALVSDSATLRPGDGATMADPAAPSADPAASSAGASVPAPEEDDYLNLQALQEP